HLAARMDNGVNCRATGIDDQLVTGVEDQAGRDMARGDSKRGHLLFPHSRARLACLPCGLSGEPEWLDVRDPEMRLLGMIGRKERKTHPARAEHRSNALPGIRVKYVGAALMVSRAAGRSRQAAIIDGLPVRGASW